MPTEPKSVTNFDGFQLTVGPENRECTVWHSEMMGCRLACVWGHGVCVNFLALQVEPEQITKSVCHLRDTRLTGSS